MNRLILVWGLLVALLSGTVAVAHAASTGGLTWKVYVQGKLVNSSADPSSYQQAPEPKFNPGQSATVHVTYITNFPITLSADTHFTTSGSMSGLYLPPGVSVTISGTSCTPTQGGGNTVLMCSTLPAGTNTITVTFSVTRSSPFLNQPTSFGYLFLEETLIPAEAGAHNGGMADFDAFVYDGSAPSTTPAHHGTQTSATPATVPKAARTTAPTNAPSTTPAATATSPTPTPSPSLSPTHTPTPSAIKVADHPTAASATSATIWAAACAGILAAIGLTGAHGRRRRTRRTAPTPLPDTHDTDHRPAE